ncbi:MAG TPA: sulfate ABC transporter permease subunit [Chloroflexota bacterium]
MLGKIALRLFALGYLGILLLFPLGAILWRTFEHGMGPVWAALTNPDAVHALRLTLEIVIIAVPLNTAFGVLCALALVRHEFRGKALLSTFVDLPLGVSPVVVGLALVLVYGRFGWWGEWLSGHGVQVIFAMPGMVLATVFISLPFVVREVVPVLREVGTEQEEAALTLGASQRQTFFRVTLPAIRSGLGYGIVLTTARALGEFGAVSVVSSNIAGQSQTMTLYVQDRFQQFDATGAYTASVTLAVLAVFTLIAMTLWKPKEIN